MQLDRNINKDGRGKYALVKCRNWKPGLDQAVDDAIRVLDDAKLLHWGNEGPGEQFFVMKYKDKFTKAGLAGYAAAVRFTAQFNNDSMKCDLLEYAQEMDAESRIAELEGNRLPD